MQRLILILGLFFFALLQCHSVQSKPKKDVSQTVHRMAKKFMSKHQIPGMAIALYKDGVSYIFPLGFADVKNKKSVTEQTIFEIGSISKVFTCVLLAQEVVDGSIDLEDSVIDYVPLLAHKNDCKKITLKRLATHTAQLPYNPPAHVQTRKDLMNHIVQWHPPKGNHFRWQYSNHGIEVVAIALEEKNKKSINELFIDKILKPLDMQPIGTKISAEYKDLFSSCYNRDGSLSTPYIDQMYLEGSGLLHASVTDMLKFLKASLGVPGTPKDIKKAMKLAQMPFVCADGIKQGLGWQIDVLDEEHVNNLDSCDGCDAQEVVKSEYTFNGNALFDKTGTTQGFHSYIAAIPNKKMGIVVMVNKRMNMGFKKIKKFGREILKSISYN